MIVHECRFEGPPHQFEDDWLFGGANGKHPGADPRWKPSTYDYYDSRAQIVWTTQVPLCDDQAIDEFTKIAATGVNPVWLSVRRPDGTLEMLPWVYDKTTDTATYREKKNNG